ncbi:hypothetical protein GH714_008327 [Hevea brasiliensis]|uniref:AB hydrolase-1 domain-containing protein n=1 Tax=Hevea brasiliensis TaxID=3981 RepID=A0A6A6M0I1_HEVBR|nr:hypothetical protein GH714_008327 [Hevea brasiliensis]
MKQKNKQFMSISLLFSLVPIVNGILPESPPQSLPIKHFVLIHGSCHGAWSWYKIVALLKSSGHNVTAVDLGASGIDLQQVSNLRSISDYHRPLMELMASLPAHEKVILVGHSLGGLAISQAMERRNGCCSALSTCKSPQDYELAITLVRPLRLFSEEDMAKEIVLTTENYGSVRRIFLISEKDEVSKKDFQLWMIQRNPPNEVIEMLGSDHMLMMSKPIELWGHLLSIAEKDS